MDPSLSVVIPLYNAEKEITFCLDSVFRSSLPHFEVIVIDDCSTDGSLAAAKRYPCRFLSTEKNSGPAKARNIGVSAARADVLLFLDSDTVVEADSIEKVYKAIQSMPEIDAVIALPAGRSLRSGRAPDYNALRNRFSLISAPPVTDYFTTQMGAIRKSAFLAAGGFDETFKSADVEEIELGMRLRPSSVFIHKGVTYGHHFPPLHAILRKYMLRAGLLSRLVEHGRKLPKAHANTRRVFSVCAACFSAASLAFAPFVPRAATASGVFFLFFVGANAGMLAFMIRERGLGYVPEALFFEYLFSLAIGAGGARSKLCRR